MSFLRKGVTLVSFEELGNIDDLHVALILPHISSAKISAFCLVLVFSTYFVSRNRVKVFPSQRNMDQKS